MTTSKFLLFAALLLLSSAAFAERDEDADVDEPKTTKGMTEDGAVFPLRPEDIDPQFTLDNTVEKDPEEVMGGPLMPEAGLGGRAGRVRRQSRRRCVIFSNIVRTSQLCSYACGYYGYRIFVHYRTACGCC